MLSDLQKRKLIKLFSMYDTTHNGKLAHQDFEKITKRITDLRNWSKRSPRYQILSNKYEHKWKQLIKRADKAHDQAISFSEWLAYHEDLLNDAKRFHDEVESLMEIVVEAFDENGDGKLSVQNWGNFLSVYSVSPVYAQFVFPQLDVDQKGYLTLAEAMQFISDFYHSDDSTLPANQMFGPY